MKLQILLIDDHQLTREALKLFLEQEGFFCEEAANGMSALAKLEAGPAVDLIISDNHMPGMTGIEFLNNLKKHSHLSSVPVILFSGIITEDFYIQAKKSGAQAVLPKPYKLESLLETVREVLSGSPNPLS